MNTQLIEIRARRPAATTGPRRTVTSLRGLLWAACTLLAGTPATAQSTTWLGTTSGNWAVASNWSNGVPDATKDAIVNAPTGSFTPSTAGAVGAACRSLTINGGGTLDFAAGFPLAVNLNAAIAGGHTGTGLLRLVGTGTANSSSGGSFPDTEITGTYAFNSCTVAGNLVQTAAAGVWTINAGNTVTVNGNATFQGPSVSASTSTPVLLNVRGDLTWATSGPVTFAGNTFGIQCGGNWTANDNFAPTSSTVTFDGPSPQTATATGTALRWRALGINSGSSLQTLSPIDVTTSLNVPAGASLVLAANQTHLCNGAINVAGTFNAGANSIVRLQGSGTVVTTGTGLQAPTIEVTGTYSFNACTITGALVHTSAAGVFTLDNGATVTVNGNATFQGQSVNASNSAQTLLNVRGNLTWATTGLVTFSNPVNVQCGGNWTANDNFAPTSSTVTFDGPAPQTATATGTALRWFSCTVQGGSTLQIPGSAPIQVANNLTVNTGGTLAVASAQPTVNGTFTVSSGGSATLAPNQTQLINGSISISGALNAGANSIVRLQGTGSAATFGAGALQTVEVTGTYSFSSCTITGALVQTSAAGVFTLNNGATVTVNGNATFQGPSVNASNNVQTLLNVRGNLTWATTGLVTFSNPVAVQCGGNWTANDNFAPTSGTVTFDGPAPQTATATGTALRWRALSINSGSSLQTLSPIDITSSLNVPAGASLVLAGNQTHRLSGGITASGALTAGANSIVRLQGTGNVTFGSTLPAPLIEVTGTYSFSSCTITGNLVQTGAAGVFTLDNGATVTVNGNATFQGLSVNASNNVGTLLNVRGNLTWATTGLVTFSNPVNVQCGGNWTANDNFAPTTSTVTFDGPAPQTATATGTALRWFSCTVAASSTLQIPGSAPIQVANHLNVNSGGTLAVASAQPTVNGTFTVSSGGSAMLAPNQTQLINGSISISGTLNAGANSIVRLQGTGSAATSGAGVLQTVEVTGTYSFSSCTITGNLVQTSAAGVFTLDNGATVTVNGNATFQGQSVNASNNVGTLLNVRGNLTWATTGLVTFSNPVNVRCGSNWTANDNFAPTSSTVTFDGPAPQTATATGTALRWRALSINSGSSLQALSPINITSSLNVPAGASLVLAANQTHLFNGAINVAGTFNAGSNAVVRLQGSGTVATSGTGLQAPTIEVTGTYSFSSCTIAGNLVQTSAAGVFTLDNGAVVTVNGNATFQGLSVNASNNIPTLLNVRGDLTWATTGLVTFSNPVNVQCGGDWTSNANFQPAAGTVEFNGTGPQQVTAVNLLLPATTVRNNANVTFAVQSLTVSSNLQIEGAFATPPTALTVQQNMVVTSTGAVTVNSGTNTVQGTLTLSGDLDGNGTLVVTGGSITGTETEAIGPATTPTIEVAATGTVTANANLLSDFVLTSGTLSIPSSSTLVLGGTSTFAGGTLTGGGAMTVDGPISFEGTLAAATLPTILARADWSSDGTFQPSSGQTNFQERQPGSPPITISSTGGAIRFFDLRFQSGSERIRGNTTANTVVINAGATVAIDPDFMLTTTAPGTMSIAGGLDLGPGSELRLPGGTLVAVAGTAVVNLLGSPTKPCTIGSSNGGVWRADVQGRLAAQYFELRDLDVYRSVNDLGGLRLLQYAGPTLPPGTQPVSLAAGLLATTATNPLGALLHLANNRSLDAYDLDFSGSGPHNVSTAATTPLRYRFFNYDGNLGGPAFEEDPNGVVDWIDQGRTSLASLTAQPGVQRVRIDFATTREVATTAFAIDRMDGAGTVLATLGPIAATGNATTGASYSLLDSVLAALVRYRFAVYELRPNRPRRWLGDVAARAWPSQVGNTRFVGPGSTFPDIATAVTASSHGDRIVAAAGTYAAFTLTKALLIVPDGSGPVVIDTTFGKLLVMNIPAGLDVALYGLTIGGASPQGMEVNNCQGVVVLDDSTVTVGSMQTALRVTDSQQVALQKVVLQTGNGGVALDLVAGPVNGSVVFAGNCTLPSLQIDATSRLVHAGTASGVPAHARATALAGTAPRLEAPLTMSGFQQDSFDIAADPFDFWALLLGGPKTFLDLSPALPVDMVLLLNPGFAFTAASGLVPPGGLVQLPVTMPDLPAGWGSAVGFQAVVLRTANNSFRLANVRDVVFVP